MKIAPSVPATLRESGSTGNRFTTRGLRHRVRQALIAVTVSVACSSGTAHAQTFSDDFNRADGPVGNGWSTFGAGGVVSGGRLETTGSFGDGGGVVRTLAVSLPARFAFDFSTAAPTDGGWFLAINAIGTHLPGPPISQISFMHFRGANNIYRVLSDGGSDQFDFAPNAPEPISGWQDYGSDPAHVEIQVNADLSATINIRYADNTEVSGSFGPTVAGPIGTQLALGNSNLTGGPHWFDNFEVAPAQPAYSICTLYDQSRPVKKGATLPIKLQLCDDDGANLSSPSIGVHAESWTFVANAVSGSVQDAGEANPDNDFRYDDGKYIFNLSTSGLMTGVYTLNFTVGDAPLLYTTLFQVK